MANSISVNTTELLKCANRIQKHIQKYNQQIATLSEHNISKLGLGWKSSDNQNFLNNANDLIGDLKKLGTELDGYVAFLKNVSLKYEETVENCYSKINTGAGK